MRDDPSFSIHEGRLVLVEGHSMLIVPLETKETEATKGHANKFLRNVNEKKLFRLPS